MSIKKGVASLALILAGIYAVQSISSNPQIESVLSKIINSKNLITEQFEKDKPASENENAFSEAAISDDKATEEDELPPFPLDPEIPEKEITDSPNTPKETPTVIPTTIAGGMVITNNTSYELDIGELVSEGTSVRLASADSPQVLIIHTHGSEAYTPDTTNNYESSDEFRTQDKQFSVIRVGDELCACLESYGLSVIHDRNIYDYPSYTGSYARSQEAVTEYLRNYPSISVVLDIHRDSIGDGDVVYKTVAEADGKPCSQIMLLVGTGENGLEHNTWQENLKFALYLQSAVVSRYSSLLRPIALKKERYNQHLSCGYLIMEVGSSGNTLPEAINAVRLFADAAAPALKELG